MGALGDGVDATAEEGARLCELLGLDPAETTTVSLVVVAGEPARIEWTGIRRVPLADVVDAIEHVQHPLMLTYEGAALSPMTAPASPHARAAAVRS